MDIQKKKINIPYPEDMFNEKFQDFVLDKEYTRKPLIVLEGGRGSAKALDISTPIPTPYGWKTIGELGVGDRVFGSDGNETNVIDVTPIAYNHECYCLEFNDGNEIIADAEHLWETETHSLRKALKRRVYKNHIQHIVKQRVFTTKEIAESLYQGKRADLNHSIKNTLSLVLPTKHLLLDPYVLGVWLGDGDSRDPNVTSADPEILYEIERRGYLVFKPKKVTNDTTIHYRIALPINRNGRLMLLKGNCKETLSGCLRVLNVHQNKHIPPEYLRASKDQRLDLLRGLMDTDGTIGNHGNECSYCSTNARLANDVEELVVSLGWIARHNKKTAQLYGKDCGMAYYITFRPDERVFYLPRKAIKQNFTVSQSSRHKHRMIVSVTPTQSVPVRCIKVDNSDSLFLAGRGMIPTHNSREISHHLILRSLKNKLRIALIRKVFDTIYGSQYTEIRDAVNLWGLQNEFEFRIAPLSIRVGSGSEFICRGLDKMTKIKSIANVDIVWVEEADELTKDDWITLNFTIRGKLQDRAKQKILSFNRRFGNWTEQYFFNADGSFKESDDIYHLHTTYLDNQFLDASFLNEIAKIKRDDPELYKKVALGLPVRLKGLVFDNWKEIDEFPENCTEIIYGLDFGYHPDPTVLLKVGRIGMDLYVDELIYDYRLTNTDLIQRMGELNVIKDIDMYADVQEPDRIEEIYRAGYYIHKEGVIKDVEFGIDFCRRYKIHITKRSGHTRKDYENYKLKVDSNNEPISPPKPAHPYSHAPDATRYPVVSHWGKEFMNMTSEDVRDVESECMESVKITDRY